MEFTPTEIRPCDKPLYAKWQALLLGCGIRADAHIDYTVGLISSSGKLVAAGSSYGQTLRCFAVDGAYRGEDLLGTLVTLLSERLYTLGRTELFLYTKCETARYFEPLGFHEVARVNDKTVFMENRRSGFRRYLSALTRGCGRQAAVVMNANPFTLGHRYLVEKALEYNDTLHVFIVSEDASELPFSLRKQAVLEGVEDLKGVICHETGPYIISRATFPSYFLKTDDEQASVQAALDASIFISVAKALGISSRWLGEEPMSAVTERYNSVLMRELPKAGIRCFTVPRMELMGAPVSASRVRELLKADDFLTIAPLVPPTTLRLLKAYKREAAK